MKESSLRLNRNNLLGLQLNMLGDDTHWRSIEDLELKDISHQGLRMRSLKVGPSFHFHSLLGTKFHI